MRIINLAVVLRVGSLQAQNWDLKWSHHSAVRQSGGAESRTKLVRIQGMGRIENKNTLVVRVGRMISSTVGIPEREWWFVNDKNTVNWDYSITRFWMASESQSKPEFCLL